MKNVFRKSALDKISSPDQLDKVLKVTSPMSWLALLGVTLIIALVVAWSFVGSLPSTITASGVIVSANTSTNTILSTQRGTVQRVGSSGARVYDGTAVLELATSSGTELVNSNLLGTVSEVLVKPGDTVENGTEILRVIPSMTENQKEIVVCFVPISDADKIKREMTANVSLTSADSNSYGHMTARVINVDAWATSQKAISAIVGSDNSMVSVLNGEGKGVCAVACELKTDPSTASGYAWSNEKGKKATLAAPQMCSVRIVTGNDRPISKLFAKLKDIWEGK
ncbi:MAG: HlyD family efflux transporter periplasmic adaptor subunit [Clostridia bacterium]|nr:HlyD family efflux transporter periplasmic adaptor subunit [Clostridia bacterium]